MEFLCGHYVHIQIQRIYQFHNTPYSVHWIQSFGVIIWTFWVTSEPTQKFDLKKKIFSGRIRIPYILLSPWKKNIWLHVSPVKPLVQHAFWHQTHRVTAVQELIKLNSLKHNKAYMMTIYVTSCSYCCRWKQVLLTQIQLVDLWLSAPCWWFEVMGFRYGCSWALMLCTHRAFFSMISSSWWTYSPNA